MTAAFRTAPPTASTLPRSAGPPRSAGRGVLRSGPVERPALVPPTDAKSADSDSCDPDESGPRIGRRLGNGGEADVYELLDDQTSVYKWYHQPRRDTQALRHLISRERVIRERLGSVGVDLVWPREVVLDGDLVQGVLLPRIPPGYFGQFSGPKGLTQLEMKLQFAVPRPGSIHGLVRTVSDQDRLRIVTLFGHFLAALHREDLVYGDLSWGNVLFSDAAAPRVLVLDLDGVAALGSTLRDVHTPDWVDPQIRSTGFVEGFDQDRYKFALLVYRMLVAKSLDKPLPAVVDATEISAVPPPVQRGLAQLLGRAAGIRGTRPQLAEWLDVLPELTSA